jgi:hypothetical protein
MTAAPKIQHHTLTHLLYIENTFSMIYNLFSVHTLYFLGMGKTTYAIHQQTYKYFFTF